MTIELMRRAGASGFTCCGPFFKPIDGSPAFGTSVYYLYSSRTVTDALTTLPMDITAVFLRTSLALSKFLGFNLKVMIYFLAVPLEHRYSLAR
jgi:hypothetical protein